MLVKFNTNLGRVDAHKYGLDWTKCTRDSEVEVSDGAAEHLIARKIASPSERRVRAVATKPEITAPAK